MQLFELVSPRLFRPLAGPNRAFYAELLLLLWEECRHTADYSISRAEAVSRAEDYFAAISAAAAVQRSVIGLPPSGAGCTMPGTPCSAPMEGGCAVFFRFRAGTFKNYTVLPFFHAKMRS